MGWGRSFEKKLERWLYGALGCASYLVLREGGLSEQRIPLTLYAGSMALSFLWQPIFYGMKRIDLALLDRCGICALMGATLVYFYRANKAACFLATPYMFWQCRCLVQNYRFWKLNRKSKSSSGGSGARGGHWEILDHTAP